MEEFPGLVIGLDVVGAEDPGVPLTITPIPSDKVS